VLAVTLDSTFNLDVPPDRPATSISTSVDYRQPGGIYRDVRLRAVPQIFLADVFAKPVNVLDASTRQVDVQATIDAAVVPTGGVKLTVDLVDGTRTLTSATVPVTISQAGQVTVNATLTGLPDVTLWDTGSPNLYTVVATLVVDGSPLHDYQVRTGFREAVFQPDGFFLNGNRVKLFGLNRHQIFPWAGDALPARVQAKDAEILRNELNCNMVRCSHYPQSEDFYDACDELGLMVWEEIPGWGYLGDAAWQQAAQQDLHDMIVRDRSRPSVIVWGAMPNEAGEHVAEYTASNELAHSLDDSRPTGGDGSVTDASFVFDVYSNHDYSSVTGSNGVREPTLAPPVDAAGKPYLICEAVGTLSGPALYYRRTDAQAVQQGEATAHGKVHNIAASDDRYCGVLAWAGFDYPSGNGNEFQGTKYVGVHHLFRIPKPGAAIYQAQIDPGDQAGHRARLLLGLRPHVPRDQPRARDDLLQPRPAQGVRGREAVRDRHAGHHRLRVPAVPAVARGFQRGGRLGQAGTAHRRLPGRREGRVPVPGGRPVRRPAVASGRRRRDRRGRHGRHEAGVPGGGQVRCAPPVRDRPGHPDRQRARRSCRRQPRRLHRHGRRGRGLDPVAARFAGHGDGQGQPRRARQRRGADQGQRGAVVRRAGPLRIAGRRGRARAGRAGQYHDGDRHADQQRPAGSGPRHVLRRPARRLDGQPGHAGHRDRCAQRADRQGELEGHGTGQRQPRPGPDHGPGRLHRRPAAGCHVLQRERAARIRHPG
jgi:hypothetical protein